MTPMPQPVALASVASCSSEGRAVWLTHAGSGEGARQRLSNGEPNGKAGGWLHAAAARGHIRCWPRGRARSFPRSERKPIGESVSIVSHLWRPFTHPAVASGPWFVPVTLREGQEGCGGSTWNPPPSRRSRARLSRWASFLLRCAAAADPPGCTCQVRALQEPAGSALSRPLGAGRFLRLFKAV